MTRVFEGSFQNLNAACKADNIHYSSANGYIGQGRNAGEKATVGTDGLM